MNIDVRAKTRIVDANAVWNGIKIGDMMEKAGEGIAKILLSKYGSKKYSILCGLGNNGGDGMIAAIHLAALDESSEIKIFIFGRESHLKTKASQNAFEKLKQAEKSYKNLKVIQDAFAKDIETTDVIVEAIIGSGIKGKLYKRFADVISKISKMQAEKVSVDIPLKGYTPSLVISLHFQKVSGAQVVDIGIPSEISNLIGPGEVRELFVPEKDSYKTKNGELFIFGGSDTFHGAPLMAIKGASKFIGTVYFYTTPGNRKLIDNIKDEVYEFVSVNDSDIEKYASYADAFLIGPGLEDNLMNRALIQKIFELYPEKPKVIDAYAIAMAPKDKLKNCILTPHRGELRHIWGDQTNMKVRRLEGNLRRFAKESGAIIILKGHTDYVFDYNGEVKLNKTGNPGMAKGGTGDILSGLAGAFITKNDPLLAAQAAIFINGLAGDLAYEEFGYNFSATDIVPFAQRGVKMCFDMDIKNNP